jgi:hypothetical protein
MNNIELIVTDNLFFIAEKYMLKRESYQSKEEISLPEATDIIKLFSNLSCIFADEVIYFFLAINKIQRKYSGSLMILPRDDSFPLFPFWLICPSEVDGIIDNYQDDDEDYQYGLPIIHGDDRILFFTPTLTEKAAQAPIYYKWGIDDPAELTLCYSSLTNLLLMVAECYETGAYYFHKSSTYGFWREDFTKSEAIFHKYHPGLPFRSPHELSHFLDNYQV